MQQIFQINTTMLNANFIESVRALFGNRDIKIVIEDIDKAAPATQKELFAKTLELRELFKGTHVPADLNISDLANEMLGE